MDRKSYQRIFQSRLLALSVRQPWAHLIVHGHKNIENRTWRTMHRGPLFIHASRVVAPVSHRSIKRMFHVELPHELPTGGIVGVVHIVDCVDEHTSAWFEGPWGWVLRGAFPTPLAPCVGSLGLFDVPIHVISPLRVFLRKHVTS